MNQNNYPHQDREPVKGGQGRSDRSVIDAAVALFIIALWLLAALVYAFLEAKGKI